MNSPDANLAYTHPFDPDEIPRDPPETDAERDARRLRESNDWHWRRERVLQRRRMHELALKGKWLADREADELRAMRVGHAVRDFLSDVLPGRCADRARAKMLVTRLIEAGYVVALRHGSVVTEPPPPAELAPLVYELQPYLCDLMEDDPDWSRNGERRDAETVVHPDTQVDAPERQPGDGLALAEERTAQAGDGGNGGDVRPVVRGSADHV